MNNNKDLILCTDWEKVSADDWYLTDEWKEEDEERKEEARKLQKENNLYIGYIVKAVDYAIYTQMDADQVLIDGDFNVILNCETAIIESPMEKAIEYDY